MVRPRNFLQHALIDELSDSTDTDSSDDEPLILKERPVRARQPLEEASEREERATIDLTAQGERLSIHSSPPSASPAINTPLSEAGHADLVTQEACLQMILDVLPDIEVEYVLTLIKENTTDFNRTTVLCDGLISAILDAGQYPKQRDQENRKRKRDEEGNWPEYEKVDQSLDELGAPYRQNA